MTASVIRIEEASTGRLVCSMPIAQDHHTRLQHARLIAAAPGLLAALKVINAECGTAFDQLSDQTSMGRTVRTILTMLATQVEAAIRLAEEG
ncbi:MAG: hypothetical protein ACREBG_03485 [Pyrinomonadaceae bacterium]